MFPVDLNRRHSLDLPLSYDFLWFYMFLVDLNRRHSLDLRLSMISYGFAFVSYGFGMFPVELNRRPSPDLRLCYDFLWFCIGFLMVLLCFQMI